MGKRMRCRRRWRSGPRGCLGHPGDLAKPRRNGARGRWSRAPAGAALGPAPGQAHPPLISPLAGGLSDRPGSAIPQCASEVLQAGAAQARRGPPGAGQTHPCWCAGPRAWRPAGAAQGPGWGGACLARDCRLPAGEVLPGWRGDARGRGATRRGRGCAWPLGRRGQSLVALRDEAPRGSLIAGAWRWRGSEASDLRARAGRGYSGRGPMAYAALRP